MATFKLSKRFTPEFFRSLLSRAALVSAATQLSCVHRVFSDQAESFKLERQSSFAPGDKKVVTIERRVRDLSPNQLEELKKLRWTYKGRCSEDVSYFYTLSIYDRDGSAIVFHAPDWNCGPSEGKRYIEEAPINEFFRSVSQ